MHYTYMTGFGKTDKDAFLLFREISILKFTKL